MATPRRVRGTSLVTRLFALVTVPMLLLGFFAVRRIQHEGDIADSAAALVDTIELQQAVGAVYPLAQIDRIALEGLARIDELNLPRDLVVLITKVDLEEVYDGNIPRFEDALARLRDDFGDTVLADGSRLDARLDTVIADIDRIRAEVDDGAATPADVKEAVEPLAILLDEALETVRLERPTGTELDAARIQLDTLSHVVSSAGEHARVLMRNVLYQTEDLSEEAARLEVRHQAFLQAHYTTLSPDQRTRLDPVIATEAGLADPPSSPARAPGAALADAEFIAASAAAVLDHIGYLGLVQDYSAEFHAAEVERAESAAAASRTDVQRTVIALLAMTLAIALFTGYVLWTILAPVRSLTRRAEAISRGELDRDPLPVKGPSDVRALVRTNNDMVVTLDRMRDQLTRMAAGELSADATADLPGAIGVTMRESVERLTQLTERLQRSEEFASAIVDEAADAIWTVDEDGTIRTANNAAARMCGEPAADQVGRTIGTYLTTTSGEVMIGNGDLPMRAVVVSSVVDVGGERITVVIAHDISERARFEERLAYQANHDALTGLPNRFSLFQHLEGRLAAGRAVVVLFVDLDGFKNVNDTQGHAVGDQVLTRVAGRLGHCVGPDDFIGRLGGDEFVIVTDHWENDAASAFGARVIGEIERPLTVGEHTFSISASVGIAVPTPGTSALDMIRQADNAVYQAKRRGRGRVEMYDDSMEDQIAHEADLELALRNATRNGELLLHLQPMIDLRDGGVVGAEALVRWQRPGIGLVPPGDFIPIAERSSLISEIERWVIAEVCRHIVDWRGSVLNDDFRIAVNISGRHLIEGDLVGDLRTILDETGADPHMLELELTETQLLEDVERATAILDELRSWGITIAVDDFGTGYSSLTYLRHLPLDTVKIDRSFVAHATEHGYDSTVIDALLTISRSLDLSVVAEGVETDDQLAYLRDRGCDRAQGFLLARPMPVADAALLLLGDRSVLPGAVV